MGLLDFFSGNSGSGGGFGLLDNMDDPRQAGMMNMALGLLSQAGPSTTPTSLGQALGRAGMLGMQGMQQAQDRQIENRMADMKAKYLQGQIDEQQSTLDEKKKINDFYGNLGRFSLSPESQALATGAAQGDVGPTVTNAERIPSMPAGKFDATAMYQAMLQSGSPTLAQAGLQGLVKERPKVKDWQKVNVDGQVLYAPYFEDGTVGKPVPYQVAEKLHFANTGGETVALNPFTGTKQASIRNTQSPESVASNAVAWANYNLSKQRLAQEQANQGKPQWDATRGQFVYAPTATSPTGKAITPTGLSERGVNPPAEYNKSATGLVELRNSLKNYRDVIKNVGGTRAVPGSDNSVALKAAHTSVMMGLKNAMELGALAGPDVEVLSGMLLDPTSSGGLWRGPDGINAQLGQVDKYLDSRTNAVEQVYGRKVPNGGSTPPKNLGTGMPSDIDALLKKYGGQ